MADRKKDWLQQELEACEIDVMTNHDPDFVYQCIGIPVTLPVKDKQAQELYKRLAKRFLAWAGKSIKHFEVRQ